MNKKFNRIMGIFGFFISVLSLVGAGCVSTSTTTSNAMGMFRSEDKGETWKAIAAVPTSKGVSSLSGVKIYRIFSDPSDPDALYVGTRGQGMYYTYDKGETWKAVDQLAGKFIYSVAVDPKDKCTIYVTDGNGAYKTTDCSRTWTSVYTEPSPSQKIVSVATDFSTPQLVYIALQGGDILVSTDSGSTWRTVKRLPFQIATLVSDPLAPKRIYVASQENGLVRSDDAGITWLDLRKPFEKFADSSKFYRLVLHATKSDALFWISKYGILRSNDAGVTWQELAINTAPGSVNIYSFGLNPSNENEMYYTATTFDENNKPLRSTFFKSINAGKTWATKKLPTNTIPVALYVHPKNSTMLFLGFTLLD